MSIKHHHFDVKKLVQIIEEQSLLIAGGKCPKQYAEMDEKIGQEFENDPRSLAILIVYISSVRNSVSKMEFEMIQNDLLSKVTHGYGLIPPFMDFVQIGYNLALRELGLEDTKNVSNGTRPLQA